MKASTDEHLVSERARDLLVLLLAFGSGCMDAFAILALGGVFISALTGKRAEKVLGAVREAFAQSVKRVTTGVLNDVLQDAQAYMQPPSTSGRRLKIYYATQQGVRPPTFVLFINDMELLHFSYERYLENQFRKAFGFEGTPLRFVLREREKGKE
jgi:GTP-binding protein